MGKGVRLLKMDGNGVVAFQKPIGVLSHPNKYDNGCSRLTLLAGVYNHSLEAYDLQNSEEHGKISRIWLLNRIDFQTSGIVLGSTNQIVTKEIKSLFKSRKVSKTYFAVVNGSLQVLNNKKLQQSIKNGLFVEWVDQMQTGRHQGLGEGIARTKVRVITENLRENVLLLELHPSTGFKHQLRYQCAIRGIPIVGDRLYGDFHLNKILRKISPVDDAKSVDNSSYGFSSEDDANNTNNSNRLYLHSSSLDFKYKYQHAWWHFSVESLMPEAFLRLAGQD